MIKVLKFGGSSVSTEDSRNKVATIIKELDCKVVVIVSAMGRYPDPYSTDKLKEMISTKLTIQEQDRIISLGETLSAAILADTLLHLNVKAISLSSSQAGLKVKDKKLINLNSEEINRYLESYDVVVLPGFQGLDLDGEVEILERGDSDYSAVYVARALGLDEVSIYSDVPGIFTADPKLVKDAALIPAISYEQALDLAAHKARIICKKALDEGSVDDDFTIYLRSTFTKNGYTQIDHKPSKVKTMSIAFNYWIITFNEGLSPDDENRVYEKVTDFTFVVEGEQIGYLETPFKIGKELVKLHFVGAKETNKTNKLVKLPIVELKSTIEEDSFYLCAKEYEDKIALLHKLVVLDPM